MTDSATTAGGQRLRITWTKSAIGYREQQRRVIRSLGLKRLRQTVEHYDSPSIRGMVNKVHHLVAVEPVSDDSPPLARETGTQRFVARIETRAAEYADFVNELLAEAEAYEAELVKAEKVKRAPTRPTPVGAKTTATSSESDEIASSAVAKSNEKA